MSRSFSVIVLCPNGRRETVKTSSNNSILQVLEEACKKQNLNPEDFDLYHYKKSLDLSLPIRFANLPNNALLELQPAKNSRKDCLVTIALQLESGERLMGDFKPASTLFEILNQFLTQDTLAFHEKGEPVCVYMRQQISGEAIKTTTLRSLGLTKGTAIIRLMFRELEQLDSQAHVSTPLTSRPVAESSMRGESISSKDPVESSAGKTNATVSSQNESIANLWSREMQEKPGVALNNNKELLTASLTENKDTSVTKRSNIDIEKNVVPVPDQSVKSELDFNTNRDSNNTFFKTEDKADGMDYNESDEEDIEIKDINYIGDRHAVLYSLDDITDVKKADLPDEFFELTVKDVRYLMEEYKRERKQMENQPLLTKEQRERQLCHKFSGYSQTVIRIYFPEKLVLQAVFRITDTVQTVSDFVRNYLEKDIHFYLYTTPPKEKLINSKTLLESLLVPAAVVHFGSDVQLPYYLNASLREKKSDPRAAALAASQSRMENVSNLEIEITSPSTNTSVTLENTSDTVSTVNESQNSNTVPSKSTTVPKWMKLSKK